MRLKELLLFGFKSFPLETRIKYGPGITIIVGPNGTGKSNIIDAFRWILGEQSFKKLRCSKIEDLIFTSLDEKKNLGYTEVCLIIENAGYFPQFGEEIEIKRRFYRSGESEFYINRSQVRLMDIQSLFLNSGALSYSFLELQKVESIISGDIRDMFEDAAGIALYRERREATQRKLQATEEGLLRLQDLLSEVERLVRSLRRQARRAQVYEELKARLKKVALYLLKTQHAELGNRCREQQEILDELNRQERQFLGEIKSQEAKLSKLKEEVASLNNQHQALIAQLSSIKDAINTDEGTIARLKENEQKVEREIELKEIKIGERQSELATISEKIKQRKTELERATGEEKIIQESFQTDASKISQREASIYQLRSTLEQKREALKKIDIERHNQELYLSQRKADRANLIALNRRIEDESKQVQAVIDELVSQKSTLDKKLEVLFGREEELNSIVDHNKMQQEQNYQAIESTASEIKKREERIANIKTELEGLKIKLRRSPLEKIKNHFQDRYLGYLFEQIQIEPGYEAIVTGALGEIINFYLIKNISEQDLTSLKETDRVGFFIQGKGGAIEPEPNSLLNYVKLGNKISGLHNYLNNFIIVADFDSALALSKQDSGKYFATKDGIIVKGEMVILGGRPEDIKSLNNQISLLVEENETLSNEIIFLEQERERLVNERTSLDRAAEKSKSDLMNIVMEIASLESKATEIDLQKERDLNRLASLTNELRTISGQVNTIEEELAKKVDWDAESFDGVSQEIKKAESDLVDAEGQYRKIIETTSDVRSNLARVQEKISNLSRELSDLQSQVVTDEKELVNLKTSIGEKREELETILRSLKAAESELVSKRAVLDEKEKGLIVKEIEDKIKIQSETLDRLNEMRNIIEAKREEILKARMAFFEVEQTMKQCFEQAQQEYNVDLNTSAIEEIENAKEKHIELLARIERIGPINPLSITEYEKEKTRLEEILKQRDDVIEAKTTLESSIQELDREAKESFFATFQQVRDEFKKVFQNFFVGGEADLVLVDETAPFDSAIEIVARPMGKKLKHIGQLSGGERTLLAISLLFAFYFVRPSPFCILDEIDAPLDDANVVRFAEFIRDLSTKTQIFLITHNKVTMEYADFIYGVTMQDPGVSKIVSVKLKDVASALEKP